MYIRLLSNAIVIVIINFNYIWFSHIGDDIYYTGITTQKPDLLLRRLLIETEERMKAVLHEVHEASGHRGASGTQERVVSQYYWLTITGDVKELVS